jgi:hypothetical protein
VLGVPERFTMASYAAGLQAIAAAAAGQPLPEAQALGVALQLADCVVESQQVFGGGCPVLAAAGFLELDSTI